MLVQKIENLESLANLEELWLGKNKITKLEVSYSHSFVSGCSNFRIVLGPRNPQEIENLVYAIQSYHEDRGVGGAGKSRAALP